MSVTERLGQFSYTLPHALADRLAAVADAHDRSKSGMLRQVLAHALPQFESPGGSFSAPPVTAAPPSEDRGTGAVFHPAGAFNESGDDRGGDVAASVSYPDAAGPHTAAGAAGSGLPSPVEPGASPVAEQMALHASHLRRHLAAKEAQAEQQRQAKEAVIQQLSRQGE
jgi:hypothetical protein